MRRGLCRQSAALAAILAWQLIAAYADGAPPAYLRAPESPDRIDPFFAALERRETATPSGSQRFLGRKPTDSPGDRLLLTDEPADHFEWPDAFWGHGQIEQAQYPLTDPPADQAPDEPRRLTTAPLINQGCDAPPAWICCGTSTLEVASILGSGNTLGITSLGLRSIVEFPRFAALTIRPIFGMHLPNGPASTDLPARLYDISLEARMYLPCGERWLGEFALAPGIFSDFRSTEDAFRLVTRVVGYYKHTASLRIAMGATYLDRQDITWLPIGGVIYVPNDDWRYELMFPRPRIAHRYQCDGDREHWVYLLGELGGGSWAIERTSGADDIATYRDLRLLLGVEFKQSAGCTWLLEAGYSFGRELEYKSSLGNYAPPSTAVVRAALNF